MSIEIKRLYLENYKLFTLKELVFSDNLCVFDGPNGYGKTSIFDAIEFIITGYISRIQDSEAIAGGLSYYSNCLANDPKKDIRIKAEFKDSNSTQDVVFAFCIPASNGAGKQNNPKSIDKQAIPYILPKYDLPSEMWGDYVVSDEKMALKRKEIFGEQNINLFKMLHYIHQEDRLAYFKKSENERGKVITDLFGIEEEVSKLKKIDEAQRQMAKKLKSLDVQIKASETEIQSLPQIINNKIEYKPLLNGTIQWDKKDLGFQGPQSKILFEQLKGQINDTIEFVKNKHSFFISTAISCFERIELSKRKSAIHGWFIKQSSGTAIDDIRRRNDTLNYLIEQLELITNDKYSDVEWKKLCSILSCEEAVDEVVRLVETLKEVQDNQTSIGKLATYFYQARETLAKKKESIESLRNGICPYCGYKWDSDYVLQEQFADTKTVLENILGSENKLVALTLKGCKKYCEEKFQGKIQDMISLINKDEGIKLLASFNNFKDFQASVDNCDLIFKHLQSSPYAGKINIANINFVEQIIFDIKASIPSNYYTCANEHSFDRIYKELYSNDLDINSITVEELKDKAKYVDNQYYSSFDKARQNLILMKREREKLRQIQEQMKTYHTTYKKAIDSYQNLVIKQIEIPFFMYCSRLLQSYQGGQGVLINSVDSKIRFIAPGGEHDILYTMSSGQLSAVLLAFSLVLSRIYSGNDFRALFIDDPIQCMDDINMISFVELLRRDFSDVQIILSTHEDMFANYIKYKFSKYNLSSQAITLKEG